MKNGTLYAKRVAKAFNTLKKSNDAPTIPDPTDPVVQLVIALMSFETTLAKAKRAHDAINEVMVDFNELRVSTSEEVAAVISPYIPNAIARSDVLRQALGSVYLKEHALRLDHLAKMGRREAKQYLLSLNGVNGSAAASIMLWSFGAHAIPVNMRMYHALQKEELVDPGATIDEVQAFLERNVGAKDAKLFCLLMDTLKPSKTSKSTTTAAGKTPSAKKPTSASKSPKKTKARATSSSRASSRETTAKKTIARSGRRTGSR